MNETDRITLPASGMRQNSPPIDRILEPDLHQVLMIEQSCYSSPWSFNQFLRELANPVAEIYGCRFDNHLCGFICYWLIAGEMQILNLAVAPAQRRMGFAGALLEHAFSRGRNSGLEVVWLEVRAGNQKAISLYRRYGFTVDGRRRGYYQDGEDALLMKKDFVAATDA